MSKRQILALLGVWVMIFPSTLLGFPSAWNPWIAVITGLLIIWVAYRKMPVEKSAGKMSSHGDISNNSNSSFVQNSSVQNSSTPKVDNLV